MSEVSEDRRWFYAALVSAEGKMLSTTLGVDNCPPGVTPIEAILGMMEVHHPRARYTVVNCIEVTKPQQMWLHRYITRTSNGGATYSEYDELKDPPT